MKKVLVLLLLITSSGMIKAQTWDEFFRQRKTQRKYLLQQIAALQVYLGYLQKGYEIANKGLNTIRSIKNVDFNLHSDFYSSLKSVNPTIKHLTQVADIIAFQTSIIKEAKKVISGSGQGERFTASEISYIKSVFDHLLDECIKDINELILVTTSGELEMKDDERIKRIDLIYSGMQDKYVFAKSFGQELAVLSLKRQAEEREAVLTQQLYGIE